MRVKHLWKYVPFRSSISLVYARVTLTPFTTAYFLVAVAHCIIQVALQSIAFSENTALASSITNVIHEAGVPLRLTAFLGNGSLEVCDDIPSQNPGSCHVVSPMSAVAIVAQNASSQTTSFTSSQYSPTSTTVTSSSLQLNSTPSINIPTSTLAGVPLAAYTVIPTNTASQSNLNSRAFSAEYRVTKDRKTSFFVRDLSAQSQIDSNGDIQNIIVSGIDGQSATVPLSCIEALSWPYEYFRDANRSDLVLLLFQFWLLTVSVVAILNESIPHLVVALAGHALSTGWGAYLIYRTISYRAQFTTIITQDACGGVNLFHNLWPQQISLIIPSLAVDGAVLPIMAYLEWKLFKVYNWQTFKRVGASEEVNRVYKLVLLFSVFLQLSAFFTFVSTALWVDELFTGLIGQFEKYRTGYEALFLFICLAQLPWLIMGWKAIRTENKPLMIIFFMIGGVVIAAWAIMFASSLYRMIFTEWPFFSALTCTSFAFLGGTLVLAVICLMNFGHGLAHYLKVQEALLEAKFTPVYFSNNPQQQEINVENGTNPRKDNLGSSDIKDPSILFPEATAKLPGRELWTAQDSAPPSPTGTLKSQGFPVLNKEGFASNTSVATKVNDGAISDPDPSEKGPTAVLTRTDSKRSRRMLTKLVNRAAKPVPPAPVIVARNAPALAPILSPARFSSRFSKSTAAAASSSTPSIPSTLSRSSTNTDKAMPPLPPPKDRDSGYTPATSYLSSLGRFSQSTGNLAGLPRSDSLRSLSRQGSPDPYSRLGRSTSIVRLSNASIGLPSNPKMHKDPPGYF